MAKTKILTYKGIYVLKLGFVAGKGKGACTSTRSAPQPAPQPPSQQPIQTYNMMSATQPSSSQQGNQARPSHRRARWFSSSQPEFHTPRETWDTLPSSSQVTQLSNLFPGWLCRLGYFLTNGSIFYFVAFTCKQEHWWCEDQRTACCTKTTKNEFSGWKE